MRLSARPPDRLSVRRSVCLSVYLSVCLPVCLRGRRTRFPGPLCVRPSVGRFPRLPLPAALPASLHALPGLQPSPSLHPCTPFPGCSLRPPCSCSPRPPQLQPSPSPAAALALPAALPSCSPPCSPPQLQPSSFPSLQPSLQLQPCLLVSLQLQNSAAAALPFLSHCCIKLLYTKCLSLQKMRFLEASLIVI